MAEYSEPHEREEGANFDRFSAKFTEYGTFVAEIDHA
jgi:hypothetical protein